MGVTLTPTPPMLWHHSRGALCRSVETFTDSLVKGMAIVWPGVVGVEGGERVDPIFFVASATNTILAGTI
jgi:hypothetical protein